MHLADGALRARCMLQVVRDDLDARSVPAGTSSVVSAAISGLAAYVAWRAEHRALAGVLGVATGGLAARARANQVAARSTGLTAVPVPVHAAFVSRPNDGADVPSATPIVTARGPSKPLRAVARERFVGALLSAK